MLFVETNYYNEIVLMSIKNPLSNIYAKYCALFIVWNISVHINAKMVLYGSHCNAWFHIDVNLSNLLDTSEKYWEEGCGLHIMIVRYSDL